MFNTPQNAPEPRDMPAMPPGAPGTGGEGEIHLLDRLSVVYRHRRLVLSIVVLVLVGGIVQTFTTVPRFKATAVVEVGEERPLSSSLRDIEQQFTIQDPEVYMETQQNVLRSRDLARTVVRKLKLQTHYEFQPGADAPSGLRAAFDSVRARITRPLRQLFQKELPRSQIAEAGAPTAGASESPEEAALVTKFLSRLDVQRRPLSRLFNVHFDARDPELAALAANTLADEYVVRNLDLKRTALDNRIKLYETEIQTQSRLIEGYRNVLFEYQSKGGTTELGENILGATIAAFASDATRARTQAVQRKAVYDQLRPVLDNPGFDVTDERIMSTPAIATDPQVMQYQASLQRLQSQKQAEVVAGHGENHPTVRRLNNDTDQTRQQLRNRIVLRAQTARQEYESAIAEANSLERLHTDTRQKAAEAGIAAVQPGFVQNNLRAAEALLGSLTAELQQTKVMANSTENNVRTMDRAEVPAVAYTPNVANNLVIALIAGLVLALGVAFGLDYLDDTIKTPEDITRKLRIPFLGLVPSVRGDKQPILSGPVPHDFGEAYRALRTSLVFTSGGEKTRVIGVTSAQPLEGKTTTACNLAMVLAIGGSRVLLIDADLRRPGVHKALKMNNTVGLSHLLVGQARVREAIQRTSDPNFCVMTAGRTPPNPSELLSSERMRQLIGNLSEGPFDWVIIDTPPVLAVTDAVVVTPMVSGIVFVLGAEMTRRRLAERAVQMVLQTRPRIVGAVLNRVNFDRNKYYYSRYYGYQYKSYYGQHARAADSADSEV
ncbi:MAG TPA: polysaccharide biosynthesis tyrosine autokinase [Vicinamibacterales bacterium]|nr:polysaccharide biosynthesis tyrosine autokinase [Vicinamibacterales bacterium]